MKVGGAISDSFGSQAFTITFTIEPVVLTLNPSTAQTIDVGGNVAFTATVVTDDHTDKKVKWSSTSGVKLYSDSNCTTEVGSDATETMTVYAKGISAGSATVTATSNAVSTKSASCNVTVNAPAHTHSFTYSANGATITATCGAEGCTLPPSTEGGTDHVATLTIAAPTVEGKYTAKITVESQTASVEYEIAGPVASVTVDETTTNYADFSAAVIAWNQAGSGATLTPLVDYTVSTEFTVPANRILDIPKGVTVTGDTGGSITNNGVISISGTVDASKGAITAAGDMEVTENGTLTIAAEMTETGMSIDMPETGDLSITAGGQLCIALGENIIPFIAKPETTLTQGVRTVGNSDGGVNADGKTTYSYYVPSGSGGGGVATNPVNVPASGASASGAVKSSAANAKAGDKVTITPEPQEGYVTAGVTVTDAKGNVVPVTQNADGTYSFTMPATAVTVTPTFEKAEPDSTDNTDNTGSGDVSSWFKDVSGNAWYRDAVQWAVDKGIMNGVSEDTFAPDDATTRAMVVTMLWLLAGEPASSAAAPFTDVSGDDWYAGAVAWAAESGATSGTGADTFSPNAPVTREQLAAILYRYAQAQGKGFEGAWMFLLDYPDADQVSDWADEAMHWMTMNGVITGMGDGTLAPQDNATRAQIATMFMRFVEAMEK